MLHANLIVQAAMGAALLAGTYLARGRSYTAHGICQTSVMLLNLVMITLVMWPSFQRQVTPALPAHLGDRYYAVGTVHAALGIAAELFGLYIVLAAVTEVAVRYGAYGVLDGRMGPTVQTITVPASRDLRRRNVTVCFFPR